MSKPWQEKLREFGLQAYNANQYSTAIKYLNAAVKEEVASATLQPHHWQSRFYLACAYYQTGQILHSLMEFSVVERCAEDAELKTRAQAAVTNLKRITGEWKRPQIEAPPG